jgi:RNase P/RNase MRP subunit POP5
VTDPATLRLGAYTLALAVEAMNGLASALERGDVDAERDAVKRATAAMGLAEAALSDLLPQVRRLARKRVS